MELLGRGCKFLLYVTYKLLLIRGLLGASIYLQEFTAAGRLTSVSRGVGHSPGAQPKIKACR